MRQKGQWLALLALTVMLAAGFMALQLPAALLLGPMVAGIIVALSGASIRLPAMPFVLAQAVVGCLIARAAAPDVLPEFLAHWHLFSLVILSGIAASAAMGLLLCRFHVMPGTTAIWGASPGGAAAMVVMADACGADARLVAFMQYLRVLCVALAATVVARLAGGAAPPQAAMVWLPPLSAGLAPALGLIGLGALVGRYTRLSGGAMMAPMFVGAALRLSGLVEVDLPPWLLAAAYAAIGWRVGLGFTRAVALYAARALPAIFTGILALIAFCGGLSWLLAKATGMDPLTAYLAASPGGMDSVAVIAAGSPGVDVAAVMTMQTLRFFLVVLLAPPMAKYLAGRAEARGEAKVEEKVEAEEKTKESLRRPGV